MKKIYTVALLINVFLIAACAKSPGLIDTNNLISPNKIVEKRVDVPVLPKVNATYGIGNDPAVVDAYNQYVKTGKMLTIRSEGWITYPYSPETKPIISCSPLHFCIIQLEEGEKLNSYGLGDTENWITNAFVTGEDKTASISIQAKPVIANCSTDLTISTNKRTYLIGLVSKNNTNTSVLRFYYPQETMIENVEIANKIQTNHSLKVIDTTDFTKVNLDKINFNYEIRGNNFSWKPIRIFDDGNKTYIEMPSITSKMNLPVLYLEKNKEMAIVNYRYEEPYFVIDGLFDIAWLISGSGRNQEKLEILNRNFK